MIVIKATKSEMMFICPYFIYILFQYLQQTEFGGAWMNYIKGFALILVFAKIIYDKYTYSNALFVWILFFALSLIIAFNTGEYSKVLPIILFLFAANNVDSRQIVKTAFYAITIVLVLTVFSSVIGILPCKSIVTGSETRYYLGFIYVSYPANFFLHGFMMYIFIRQNRPKLCELILAMTANLFIFYFTRTKMVFFTSLLLIVLWGLFPFLETHTKKFKAVFGLSFTWCAIIAIVIQLFYDSSKTWMAMINTLTTYRLRLGHDAILKYGFSLLGQKVGWEMDASNGYLYVDSSYVHIGIKYGMVLLLLLIFGFTYLLIREIKNNRRYSCLALFGVALHAVTDPQLFSIMYNPFLFVLSSLIPIIVKESREGSIDSCVFATQKGSNNAEI